MIKGLIVGHRDFGKAILNAMESISGSIENIEWVSNDGLSTNELAEKIRAACELNGEEGILVFVDVYGGSCWRAAKMARASNARIITGINLPMLLSFIHKRETISLDELPAVMENDGKRAIQSE